MRWLSMTREDVEKGKRRPAGLGKVLHRCKSHMRTMSTSIKESQACHLQLPMQHRTGYYEWVVAMQMSRVTRLVGVVCTNFLSLFSLLFHCKLTWHVQMVRLYKKLDSCIYAHLHVCETFRMQWARSRDGSADGVWHDNQKRTRVTRR